MRAVTVLRVTHRQANDISLSFIWNSLSKFSSFQMRACSLSY